MIHTHRICLLGFARHRSALGFVLGLALTANAVSANEARIPELKARAENGFLAQEIELAAAYLTGHGVAQDLEAAAYWYQKAAERGSPEAQNQMGYLYETGTGVPANSTRAFHWYQLSAASGFAKAKVNLGVLYVWGTGVPKDEALAAQFFREAAEKGIGVAAAYLGDMYYFGIGMRQDKSAAEKWFATGVKLHDPIAAFDLGVLFSAAEGHSHDLQKAAMLLRESVAAGYVPAMHALGMLLVNNPQLARSADEALSLLKTASDAGSWKSSVILGVLDRDGRGVPINPEAAYLHFHVAVLQGGDKASRLLFRDLQRLSAQLTDQQSATLKSQAEAWFEQHHLELEFVYKDGEGSSQFPTSALAIAADGAHVRRLVLPPPA